MRAKQVHRAAFIALFTGCVAAGTSSNANQNTITFDNKSGQPALVRLSEPSPTKIEVPSGSTRTVTASAGRYVIKMRYGSPGKYHYAKGEAFDVIETPTTRSQITITLHKVAEGNYESWPISEDDFASDEVASPLPPRSEVVETPLPQVESVDYSPTPESLTLAGRVLNVESNLDLCFAQDWHLQLVPSKAQGLSLDVAADGTARWLWTSDLPTAKVDKNGHFAFRDIRIPPGAYEIVGQLAQYKPEGKAVHFLCVLRPRDPTAPQRRLVVPQLHVEAMPRAGAVVDIGEAVFLLPENMSKLNMGGSLAGQKVQIQIPPQRKLDRREVRISSGGITELNVRRTTLREQSSAEQRPERDK